MKNVNSPPSPEDRLSEQLYWTKALCAPIARTTLYEQDVVTAGRPIVFRESLVELPSDLCEKIIKLSRNTDLSTYSILVAGLTIVLSRYTGSGDIVIGSPAYTPALRREYKNLLVPLRFKVSGYLTFKEYLSRTVGKTILEAYANQEYYGERITDAPAMSSADQQPPIFDIVVSLQGIHKNPDLDRANRQVAFHFSVHENRISARVSYDSQSPLKLGVDLIIAHQAAVLGRTLDSIDERISEIELLTVDEKSQLLFELNRSAKDYPDRETLWDLFSKQVREKPHRVALSMGTECVTYGELKRRAERLGSRLHSDGIGPEIIVGIMCARNIEFVTGALGIFAAGAAYLPLDPEHPSDRVRGVLKQSGVGLVLVSGETLAKAREVDGDEGVLRVKGIEELVEDNSAGSEERCTSVTGNLAYVIYTSGSTGIPKGAMIDLQGMVNHLHAKIEDLGLCQHDVVAQTASQCFDISVWQLLAALLVGGRVEIISDEVGKDPLRLIEALERQRVTILESVPALVQALVEQLSGQQRVDLSAMRWMIVTGEAFGAQLCREWMKRNPKIPVMNAYGPTECSDDVTHCEIRDEPGREQATVPIGKPVGNMKMYVADEEQRLAPMGMPGELYVGGVGVGRGYLNDPGRTAEVFVADACSGVDGKRLYKTGDVVRYGANGELEFIGRKDHQVKIRGYRIELGEIEALLAQQHQVKEVVVLAEQAERGERRLVGYIVPKEGKKPGVRDLREYLQGKLPDYMAPASFVLLDRLPLTPNGKVDRRALAQSELEANRSGLPFVAPGTAIEELLTRTWAEVLGLASVGIHDNFFELGGDSILGIRIVAKANKAGLHLTPKQLFDHQTVAELAGAAGASPASWLGRDLKLGPVPLTPIQRWFLESAPYEPNYFNQSILLTLTEDIVPDLVEKSIQSLSREHDALGLRFERRAAGWIQTDEPVNQAVHLERIDLRGMKERGQEDGIDSAARRIQGSFSLSEGPLLKAAWFALGGGDGNRLLIVIHHLVVDIVSWHVLLEDFWMAYEQLQAGKDVRLGGKTTSFKYWAQRLTKYAESDELVAEMEYWRAKGEKHIEEVPRDIEDGENTEGSARTVTVTLSEEETEALLREVPKAYHTQISEVLLAALARGYQKWSGHSRLLVDLEGHGREGLFEGVDLTRTVGWFTTIYPIILEVEEGEEAEETLKTVKVEVRGIPKGGIGYGLLRYVRQGEIGKELGAQRQAEIIFNYGGQLDQAIGNNSAYRLAKESSGRSRSSAADRRFLLTINGGVTERQFTLFISYSQNTHNRSSIEAFAREVRSALRSYISDCKAAHKGARTPSDFPGAMVNQDQLEKLLSKIKANKGG
jgi:amino acid adenylation domain-containing protein/non-ribosomal peptide synthase protein (TIGR01720 family)